MASFIESLESRTLLSTAPSVAALNAGGRAVNSEGIAFEKVIKANIKLITADLKAAGELKDNKGPLKTLSVQGLAADAVTSRGITRTESLIKADVNKLLSFAAFLRKHPTSVKYIAKVGAAINTLGTDASNRLATIDADLTSLGTIDTTNVNALLAAVPSDTTLANDINNIAAPNINAANTALMDAVMTTLITDVEAVIAAFPS